jgi:hypothetical protein
MQNQKTTNTGHKTDQVDIELKDTESVKKHRLS